MLLRYVLFLYNYDTFNIFKKFIYNYFPKGIKRKKKFLLIFYIALNDYSFISFKSRE